MFVTLEARDPTLATMVHDLRTYQSKDIRFGMRYMDAITIAEDGTPVANLTKISALEPDLTQKPVSCPTDPKNISYTD